MNIVHSPLNACFVIEPKVFKDDRGYFFESFNQNSFQGKTGVKIKFNQDNEAASVYGVVRGLHYQHKPYAQTKLVRAIVGRILDVAVDLRKDSKTFGQYFSVELSGENKKQLFVPHGFAHGYSVLSETAIVAYKCDNFYNKEAEGGIDLLDSDLNIDWGIKKSDMIISDKDKNQKTLKEIKPLEV